MRAWILGAIVASTMAAGGGDARAEQPPEPDDAVGPVTNDPFAEPATPPPPPEPPRWRRRSPGMMIGGGVLTGLGVVSLGVSIPFFVEEANCRGDFCAFYTAFGFGFVGLGAIFLGIGIPLTVAGSKLVYAGAPTLKPYAIHVGPGSAALEWKF